MTVGAQQGMHDTIPSLFEAVPSQDSHFAIAESRLACCVAMMCVDSASHVGSPAVAFSSLPAEILRSW